MDSAQSNRNSTVLEFDLSIDPHEGGYRVRVLDSPFGQASLALGQLPAMPEFTGTFNLSAAQQWGQQLFDAVFQGEVLGLLRRSLDEADRLGCNLRLNLRLGNEINLTSLPWEYLFDSAGQGFLALMGEIAIVRYIEVAQPSRSLAVTLPLRVLVILSSPEDYPILDVEKEWQSLQNALATPIGEGLVSIDRLDQATPARLQGQLRQAEYHVVHFIGHGSFDEDSQEGLLLFEDEHGNGRPLNGRGLRTLLGGERRSLVLVVLNACEGARRGSDPFSGVAQNLVQLGVPAVIANQAPLDDAAATALAGEFYQSLAEGLPVDTALAEGRKAIYATGDEISWGIPSLFLRSASDGYIFRPATLNVGKVVTVLEQSLPPDDPMARNLAETIQRLQGFHVRLHEWKELHNYLNDITMVFDQFEREVERLDASGAPGDPRQLARLWRPVAQKLALLIDWAATIQYIDQPLQQTDLGIQGPAWATDLFGARDRVEDLLNPHDFDLLALYDATYDLADTAQRHLFLADKSLREAAGELYNLSRQIVG